MSVLSSQANAHYARACVDGGTHRPGFTQVCHDEANAELNKWGRAAGTSKPVVVSLHAQPAHQRPHTSWRHKDLAYHHVKRVTAGPVLMESSLWVGIRVLSSGIGSRYHGVPARVENERVPKQGPDLLDYARVVDKWFECRLHLDDQS